MFFHLPWFESREYRENTLRSTSHFSFAVTQPRLVPRRDSLLWSLQIHIDMSHAILHSLISQHCAHWTHCCTHTHYRAEQETTYTVPETTTRQKSLVKDHLHSFLVASTPSREILIYQEIWAVVPSHHCVSLHLGGDRRVKGRCSSAAVFSFQFPAFPAVSFSWSLTNLSAVFSHTCLTESREHGTRVETQSSRALTEDRVAAVW